MIDNIIWNALVGPHAALAVGARGARRYVRGFSPLAAFEDRAQPDFDALAEVCEPGEPLYLEGWSGAVPAGWRLELDDSMHQMVWDAPLPPDDASLDALPLGAEHVPAMLQLVALTQPGPFGPRTVELGDYFGVFDGTRLVAMAGERMAAGRLREISGVCTHPDAQGRGFAKRLVARLVRRQLQRAETPFLHVMHDNVHAQRIYAGMGFRLHRRTPVRVVSREAIG